MKIRRSSCRAMCRAAAMTAITLIYLMLHPFKAMRAKGLPETITRRWHAHMCKLGGIDVTVHGKPVREGRVLYVANHISYIDILAIGGIVDGCFIAKSEVAGWPVFGWLARQRRTVFVARRSHRAKDQGKLLRNWLDLGDDLILFPEGTSSDGTTVLPFKSSLFAAVEGAPVSSNIRIQPITIAYTRYDSGPMCEKIRPCYAWYGDMTFGDHLWFWLGLKQVGIDIVFHAPVPVARYASRKDLAAHCQYIISAGLQDIAET